MFVHWVPADNLLDNYRCMFLLCFGKFRSDTWQQVLNIHQYLQIKTNILIESQTPLQAPKGFPCFRVGLDIFFFFWGGVCNGWKQISRREVCTGLQTFSRGALDIYVRLEKAIAIFIKQNNIWSITDKNEMLILMAQ